MDEQPPVRPPWRSGRFAPIAFLGRGSSGLVYRALDRETGTEIALKTLAERDAEALYRLKQEFRACAGIRHRNLVELYELHVGADDSFFTMELVEGVDVVQHVRGERAADAATLVRFLAAARQLIQGLAALHAAGRLHRDVKPPNALVDASGRVVLLDFGFMVPFGAGALAVEQSDTVAGSLAYMAPEILWGNAASPASDWYSAGVLFHEALSGELPFDGPPTHVGSTGVRRRPRRLPATVPSMLKELIEGLLSPEPTERPVAAQIARVIDTCSAEQRGVAIPAPLADELPFVGRASELARLDAALRHLRTGRSTVVHVRGTSGIGKSELVRRFLAGAERDVDAVVLRGRCHPYEAIPYRAFDDLVDSLSRYLSGLPHEALEALVPRHAGMATRLFPVLGRVAALAACPGDEIADVQEQRRRGFAALRELLARLGERRRLLLWIDDVQWADPDSAALARELFTGIDPPQALVLLSYRSEDRAAVEHVSAFASGREAQQGFAILELDLQPLQAAEARVLAERFAGGRLADVSPAVDEAGGSPFFLGQLVRHLVTTAGHRHEKPPDLAGLLQARLEQLGPGTRDLLEVVSVAGRPLEPRIALTAANLSGVARRELINLQEERLLRLSPAADGAVEVYHDRIREAVIARLGPGALRERHRGLAQTLVREKDADAQALYRHFLGAGETTAAADWAVVAAERADGALAFAEAAELYRRGLELRGHTHASAQALTVQRATALVNAGRGAEAAPLFLAAADQASALERLDLRRRAAEQYLQTGHIDEGVRTLQELVAALDLPYPRALPTAAIATLLRLGLVAMRGTRPFRRRPDPSARDLLRLEAARSAAKGLAMVDPFRGLFFAVRCLALAVRAGRPDLIVREQAAMGATLVPAGPPFDRWAARMLVQARARAQAMGDPYLIGLTAITSAQLSMVEANWARMLELCDSGARTLREHCRGVSWELALAAGPAERALEELGRYQEMGERGETALRQAEEAGDVFRVASAALTVGIWRLVENRVDEARAFARRVRTAWTRDGFHMQHFYAARLEAYCDLRADDPVAAWRRLDQLWPQLRKSGILRHALIRVDATALRARVALSCALHGSAPASSLRCAERDAAVLESLGRPDASATAKLVRAAIAAQRGQRADAVQLAEPACSAYGRLQMGAAQAAARWRLAALSPEAESAAVAADAFARLGVRDFTSLLAMLAPGFPTAAPH